MKYNNKTDWLIDHFPKIIAWRVVFCMLVGIAMIAGLGFMAIHFLMKVW